MEIGREFVQINIRIDNSLILVASNSNLKLECTLICNQATFSNTERMALGLNQSRAYPITSNVKN